MESDLLCGSRVVDIQLLTVDTNSAVELIQNPTGDVGHGTTKPAFCAIRD